MCAGVPQVPPPTTAVIGREAELGELSAFLDSVATGQGGLALITGEAGAGRTTLALEVRRRAVALGFSAHWAACSPAAAGQPYWPWSQLIQSCLSSAPPDAVPRYLGTISRALPAIAPGLADQLAIPPPEHQRDQFAHFQAVARFWAAVATDQGRLLLVINDLHWSDPGSVHLLAHVATMLRQFPVALLATVRAGGRIDGDMALAHAELDRCAPVAVPLGGLPTVALVELARQHGLAPDAATVDLLARRSGGNPYFATELVRAVGPPSGGTAPTGLLAAALPRVLVRAIRARVAALDPAVGSLLEAASVIGPAGPTVALSLVAELDHESTADLVDQAGDAGLLTRTAPTSWRFVHTVVRDALEHSLSTARRRQLHERAVAALEAAVGSPPAVAYPAEGGDLASVVTQLVAEGREHMHRHAYGLATECFAQAVALTEDDADSPEHATRLLLLAEARYRGGDTIRAEVAYHAAAQAAGGDPEFFGAAALGLTEPGVGFGHAAASGDVDLLRQALAAFGDTESATTVRLMTRLGTRHRELGDRKRGRSVIGDALAMASRVGDASASVVAMAAHHRLLVIGQAPLGTALAESAEMVELATTAGDSWAQCLAHRARFLDLVMDRDLTGADAQLAGLARVAAGRDARADEQWWVVRWRAMRALLSGHHAHARVSAVRARELGRAAGIVEAESSWLAQLVFIHREQDRLADLEETVRAHLSAAPYTTATDTLVAFRAAELGEDDEAADALSRLIRGLDELREDSDWAGTWFQLARVAHLVDDRASAAILYESGAALSGQCVLVGEGVVCTGAADLALAWLAHTLGGPDAARWYESAEVTNVAIGAIGWLAQTRLDHARLLAAGAVRDDLQEASRLARLAGNASARTGLRGILAAADDLRAGLAGRLAAPEPYRAAPPAPPAVRTQSDQGMFRRLGAVWELVYGGRTVQLPHAKGLADLAQLLARPGEPMHVSELVALQAPGSASPPPGSDEVFDARARREIRQRLADLEVEAEDAADNLDLARAERARAERAEIVAALSAAVGLGGRSRRLDDPTERARKTVTARIRSSIGRIATEHPVLGRHLERSIDTGLWCAYRPEEPTSWRTA